MQNRKKGNGIKDKRSSNTPNVTSLPSITENTTLETFSETPSRETLPLQLIISLIWLFSSSARLHHPSTSRFLSNLRPDPFLLLHPREFDPFDQATINRRDDPSTRDVPFLFPIDQIIFVRSISRFRIRDLLLLSRSSGYHFFFFPFFLLELPKRFDLNTGGEERPGSPNYRRVESGINSMHELDPFLCFCILVYLCRTIDARFNLELELER